MSWFNLNNDKFDFAYQYRKRPQFIRQCYSQKENMIRCIVYTMFSSEKHNKCIEMTKTSV